MIPLLHLIPAVLVHSSISGLAVSDGVRIDAWQETDGTARIEYRDLGYWWGDVYWVSADWAMWSLDVGQPCPYAGGYHYVSATGYGPTGTIKPELGFTMFFNAENDAGESRQGQWSEPCNWSLAGGRSTSGDLFAFLADFLDGWADFNLDQQTDTDDLFDFLYWFLQ